MDKESNQKQERQEQDTALALMVVEDIVRRFVDLRQIQGSAETHSHLVVCNTESIDLGNVCGQ